MLRHSKTKDQDHDEKKHSFSQLDLNQFDSYYDDSSDEDEIEEKLTSYNIIKSWKQKEKKSRINDNIDNDELLSFIAHAAGIKLLYSHETNTHYYPLKKQYLSGPPNGKTALTQVKELINSVILKSVNTATDSVTELYDISKISNPTNKQLEQACKDTQNNFIKNIDKLILDCILHITSWIKLKKYCSDSTLPDNINQLIISLTTQFTAEFKKNFSLGNQNINRNKINEELFDLAKQTMNSIGTELKFDKKEKSQGKKEALNALNEYKSIYPNLTGELKNIISNYPARGYVQNTLLKSVDAKTQKNKLITAYTKDLITANQSQTQQKSLLKEEKNCLSQYLTLDDIALEHELSNNLHNSLEDGFKDILKNFYRPTLNQNHTFQSDNPYAFYANLRLSSRSQKRNITNMKHALFKGNCVTRLWRFNSSNQTDTDVIETQEILSSFGRKDLILSLGNYEKVYETILQIQKHFEEYSKEIDDALIATWLREIFQGKSPCYPVTLSQIDNITITRKLQSIVYLLFGCEAVRNPAMHIISHMLLDLIIHDENWTFKSAFTKQNTEDKKEEKLALLPMAPEGAVSVARALDTDYRPYMPYSYYYRGVEESRINKKNNFCKSTLVTYEAHIVREWSILNKMNKNNLSQSEFANSLLMFIENHIDLWLDNKSRKTLKPKE